MAYRKKSRTSRRNTGSRSRNRVQRGRFSNTGRQYSSRKGSRRSSSRRVSTRQPQRTVRIELVQPGQGSSAVARPDLVALGLQKPASFPKRPIL